METIVRREKDGGYIACAWDPAARWTAAIGRGATEHEADARARAACSDAQRTGAVSATLLAPRGPGPAELYEEYLSAHGLLGMGIEYREIVRPGSPRHLLPPSVMWPAIIATLASAHWIRTQVIAAGGHGIAVHAAHRVAGGAPKSKHIVNAALDLDLLSGDVGLAHAFLNVGARYYQRHGHLKIGIGSYHLKGTMATRRLHIDAGVRRWARTVWQYSGTIKIRSPAIAAQAKGLR